MPATMNCSASCLRFVDAVAEARDGEEALLKIEQTQPDLLLLDIGMPVLDGFAVVR
jgi:YesN/AraC family two-component response regulator